MRENLMEAIVHLLLIIIYGIGALGMAIVGLIIEYHSYLYAISGEYPLAAWIGFIGLIVFLFSYLLVTDKLIPSLQSV